MKYLLSALLAISLNVYAEELPKTLEMATEVGKVVLTVEPCQVTTQNHGFIYRAYATDKNSRTGLETVHEGCWNKDVDIVNIWFYNEDPSIIATYKDYYFVPPETL